MAIVTIVGRPNVGKSSLFNRLVGKRESIVDDVPGVTRDRIYGEVLLDDASFFVVDTGGLIVNDTHPLVESMNRQIQLGVEESDVVVLVIDGRDGITWMDEDVAEMVRKSKKPVIVAVNKIDDTVHENMIYEAYNLGFENVTGLSTSHNRNISELLDMIVKNLPDEKKGQKEENEIGLAVIGRPNVGKSSFINKLTGQERSIVSDIPGTTRDSVDSVFLFKGNQFRIADTAGLRKRSKIKGDIEFYSQVRALQAVSRSDVVVLVLDGTELVTDQDKKLAAQVMEKGKGLVTLVNKWDLLPRVSELGDKIKTKVREELHFVAHAPLLFVSSKTGRGFDNVLNNVLTVFENRKNRISTNVLNRLVRDILAFHKMPTDRRGRSLKIFYCSQTGTEPPSFVFFVNFPEIIDNAFNRFMEREIRKLDNFEGVPLKLFWRQKS